jgi:3-oxo-5-alpha-steroid 4-dehydrogenase 3 / polyprenol reductase
LQTGRLSALLDSDFEPRSGSYCQSSSALRLHPNLQLIMTPFLRENFGSSLLHVDVSLALKTFYLGSAAAILFAYKLPPLKDRFLAYGARSAVNETENDAASRDLKSNRTATSLPFTYGFGALNILFDFLATLQVPHSWFMSFYCILVASSILWAHQLLTRGPLYQAIANWTHHEAASMSLNQIIVCWSLMAIQGIRRLWECLVLTKRSQSKMWVFHWLVGVLFYIATGVSIWIEGVPTLDSTNRTSSDIQLAAPSLRVLVFLPTFLLASILQYKTHAHLASLKKYTLPSHPAFNKIVCPHYTAECLLYLALTFLAAPKGHLVNGTMLCATIFVVVNLGITADISKSWAMAKFGKERIEEKWRMLPGLW